MRIINPNEKDLAECFPCNKRLADILIKKYGLISIYCKGDIYYFRRTKQFNDVLNKLGWFDLLLNRLNI